MNFAPRIVAWQRRHGRHDLPWQNTRDPYRIWLSEIMLQQTQVSTVIPYYQRFLERFPDLAALAAADQDEVMPYWAGLGYYARARNLHRCAQEIVRDWNGRFPPDAAGIATLPGIGRSTAAAIAAFAYGETSPIMDGNVKRVFTRHFGIAGDPSKREVETRLWTLAEEQVATARADAAILAAVASAAAATPEEDPVAACMVNYMASYTQGLMDLGATLCTRGKPDCARCPVQATCVARIEGRQAELPTPKARKATPERSTGMLVLRHGGRVLLQQRPSPGIWGGLWSLPEFDPAQGAATACETLGAQAGDLCELAAFAHTFTHFRLHVRPWLVTLRQAPATVAAPQRWVDEAELAQVALPAPVRKLLDGLFAAGLPHMLPA
ncbi:A/G-specific adenine glycosylase [Achromobacter aloeverae]|uniref:Adenine DNA glycosylase n=1 Tax=Achromobacter aloeverae TaxID=1750518 RepID=A0A4Q1HEE1_9BURK|nr:A/G-specific adenine glycosylase [Achromobacter aloeverae]RXN84615.1 A/G-specific adenine glycosylase [Achromobacter aloeverae]